MKKEDGIYVTIDSFSPFVIGWKEVAVTEVPRETLVKEETEQQTSQAITLNEPETSNGLLIGLLIVLLIGCIGGVGYYIYCQKKKRMNSRNK